jgi:hypothetical protein
MNPRSVLLALVPAVLLAPAVEAQDGFLFDRPQAQLTVRAGPVMPRAQGDIFELLTTELTLNRADFRAPALAAELAFLATQRLDVALGFGWSQATSSSEFADWTGADGDPIAQTTRFRTMPVTATARFHLLPRGRSVSRLAWVPTRTMPYIGGGAGMTWYRLQQEGDFLDTQACEADPDSGCAIFYREYDAGGHAATLHGVAGVDHWFTPRLGLNLEARYTLGSAPGSESFRTYDTLDLSGLQAMLGLTFRW